MNKREKLELLIEKEGFCDAISTSRLDCPDCPLHVENDIKDCSCGCALEHAAILTEACRLLAEMNEWQPLEKDNLPPDILTGDYAFQRNYCSGWKTDYECNIESIMKWLMSDLYEKGEYFRYRLRKPSPPTVEELAEAYAHDVYENAPPAFDFQRYIKQAYIDGRKSMEVADDK